MAEIPTEKAIMHEHELKEELQSLVAVLADGDRQVFAFVVTVEPPFKDNDNMINYSSHAFRWHSNDFTRPSANAVLEALEREVKRLKGALGQ